MLALLHSVPLTVQQATAHPCLRQRLLETHRQVWVSLLWGHCFFLLNPAVQETQVQSLGWEDPLEKGMATHSSVLA